MRCGKSAGKFLPRMRPCGTHDSGAVLHRCEGVEGCGECPQVEQGVGSMGVGCPQAGNGVGSHRRTIYELTRPLLVVSPAAA